MGFKGRNLSMNIHLNKEEHKTLIYKCYEEI